MKEENQIFAPERELKFYFGFLQPYGHPGKRRGREHTQRCIGHYALSANCLGSSYE